MTYLGIYLIAVAFSLLINYSLFSINPRDDDPS